MIVRFLTVVDGKRKMEIKLEDKIVKDIVIRLTPAEVQPLMRMKVVSKSQEPKDYSRIDLEVDCVGDYFEIESFLDDLQRFLVNNVETENE